MDSILVSFHAQRTRAFLLMPSRRDIETCWRQKEVMVTMLNILATYVDLNIKEGKVGRDY
jgi:hypothetical protein